MYVGVILNYTIIIRITTSVPHVCGGDPEERLSLVGKIRCSPCMWG